MNTRRRFPCLPPVATLAALLVGASTPSCTCGDDQGEGERPDQGGPGPDQASGPGGVSPDDPCGSRDHLVSPGATETVEYEVKLDRTVYDLPHLKGQKIEGDDIELVGTLDHWEKMGAKARLRSKRVHRHRSPGHLWGVDASPLLSDFGGGRPVSIESQTGANTKVRLIFTEGRDAVIDQLGAVGPAARVAALSESEVEARLGDRRSVSVTSPRGRAHELRLRRIRSTRTTYSLSLRFQVTMPSSTQQNTGCERWYRVNVRGVQLARFPLTFTHDGTPGAAYHVSGPGYRRGCDAP